MRTTIHAASARGIAIAISAALLLIAGPAAAEAKGEPQRPRAAAQPITSGAGYEDPQGSERVRTLQRRLRRAGADPGPVDGLFGPLTEAAVRRFQGREGLAVDGLVGRLTTAALKREAALLAPGAGYGDPDGSKRVRALQRRLRRSGAEPGPIDGRFGPLTEAAVRRFQGRRGLRVDGLVGEATRAALARRAAAAVPERRRAGTRPRPPTPGPQPAPAAEHGPTAKPEPRVGANPRPAPDRRPSPGFPPGTWCSSWRRGWRSSRAPWRWRSEDPEGGVAGSSPAPLSRARGPRGPRRRRLGRHGRVARGALGQSPRARGRKPGPLRRPFASAAAPSACSATR